MIDRVVYIQPEVGKEVVSFNSNQSEQLDKNTTVLSQCPLDAPAGSIYNLKAPTRSRSVICAVNF